MLFHIGYHKTASTTLQKDVFPRVDSLRQVTRDGLGRWVVRHMADATDEDYCAQTCSAFFREAVAAADGRLVVASQELLSGRLWADPVGTGIRSAHRVAGVAPDPKVLLIVRRQSDLLQSIHAQYVNVGGTAGLAAFLEGDAHGVDFDKAYLCFDRLVEVYDELIGPESVIVEPYEALSSDLTGTLGRLFDRLGLRHEPVEEAARLNRSMSSTGLRLMRGYNRLFSQTEFNPTPLIRPLLPARNTQMRRRLQRRLPRKHPLPPIDHLLPREWRDRYAESNRRLDERLGGALRPHGYAGL